jgi:membrane protein
MNLNFKNIKEFLHTGIWRIRSKDIPRNQYLIIRPLRVFLLALREFTDNKCQLYASALTFYTLLSIVPIFAMAFGIAKGFGFEKMLENQLYAKFPGQEETITKIIQFSHNLLIDTRGGVIAGVGVIVLFWSAIRVLNSIEESFNDIWGIKKARTLVRKITDYLTIMMISPFLLIASSSITVFLTAQINLLMQRLSFLEFFGPLVYFVLQILPYVMLWILFAFVYIFMPNTKVNIFSGLTGGIAAGTLYQILQILYIKFQIGVGRYNAIYGSFAALPLFLIWLQLSWRIVLFGTEITFAHQNAETYEFERDCLNISPFFKKLLTFEILTLIIKRFGLGKDPLSSKEISDVLDIPVRLVENILFTLSDAGLLTGTANPDGKQLTYQPSRDISSLSYHSVMELLDKKGSDNIPIMKTPELVSIRESMKGFSEEINNSKYNKLLKDI